jgi:heptosyltransferase III
MQTNRAQAITFSQGSMIVNADRRDCVLIFRLGSIGDTVVALPCFHAIARTFPSYRRVLLTNALTSIRASSAESVLADTGLIDQTIYYPVGDFRWSSAMALNRELRRLRPATMIYLAERPRASAVFRDLLFFKAAGIPKIVGAPWRRELRNCIVDPATHELEHEAARLARTLAQVAPVSLAPSNWDLHLSASDLAKAEAVLPSKSGPHPLLAVAPGAKIAAKNWGAENWARLLDSLADDYSHMTLVIVGAADEHSTGAEVSRHWGGNVLNLCGVLTPRETAAVLRRCRLLICHDSGPMHLAASQQTPCVALFGNLNRPRQWYPFGDGHHVIQEPRGIQEISPRRVAEEVRLSLGATSKARQTGAATQ